MAKDKTKGKKKAKKPQKPEVREVASLATDADYSQLVNEIAKPNDTVLKALGWRLEEYRAIGRDDQVQTCMAQRKSAQIAKEIIVDAGGKNAIDVAAADFIREQLANVNFDSKCRMMMTALMYGYSVAEAMWDYDQSRIVLADIKVRAFDRFQYDKAGNLRLKTKSNPKGIILEDRKFWVCAVEGDHDDDPYGLGLAYYLYWPVYLKRNGLRYWAIALEKFGMPTAVGKHHPGATEDEVRNLLTMLASIHGQAAVTLPEGQAVSLLEATRASGGDHAVFCKYLDAMISKIILGQTSTTDSGTWRGTAEVHKGVKDELVKADADLLCASLNSSIVRWLTEWNFAGAKLPKVWRDFSQAEDLNARIKRDKEIYNMGFDPDPAYINATYGGAWTKRTQLPVTNSPAVSFAEQSDLDAIDEAVEDILHDWQPMADPAIGPVLDMVYAAKSLEDIRDGLGTIYPDMDIDAIAEPLARLSAMTEIATRAGAEINEN